MAGIPDSIQVEYGHAVPLEMVRDSDGLALDADTTATVPVLLNFEGGSVVTVFCEGPLDVWFKICSSTAGRATFASHPVTLKNKEPFLLPKLPLLADRNYISVIARGPTKCTVNVYPRGT